MIADKRRIALAVLPISALGSAAFVMMMCLSRTDADEKKPPTPTTDEDPLVKHGTRQAFARAMSKIQVGMLEKEVLALLGKPNDIQTDSDPGGISFFGDIKEIWGYGTDGHLSLPTLGRVSIAKDGKVESVDGGRGEPPDSAMFREAELRLLLRLIDEAPSYDSNYNYNPLAVIRIVNALQPLGKDKALAAIDEYLRVGMSGRGGLFLVLRVLFDVPADPGYMPPMYVGVSEPPEPKDPKRLPRFPILLQDDVPLLLVWGYEIDGSPEQPDSHVKYFRDKGRLREKPLSPGNDPLALLDAWAKNAGWLYREGSFWDLQQGKVLIANQLLNLIDSVHRREKNDDGYKFGPTKDFDGDWKAIKDEVGNLNIRWSAQKNRYTFRDGSYLPEPKRVVYRRYVWKLEGMNGQAELVIERSDKKNIQIDLHRSAEKEREMPSFTLTLFDVKDNTKALKEMRPKSVGANSYSGQGWGLALAEGTEVQVRLKIGDREELSPVYKP